MYVQAKLQHSRAVRLPMRRIVDKGCGETLEQQEGGVCAELTSYAGTQRDKHCDKHTYTERGECPSVREQFPKITPTPRQAACNEQKEFTKVISSHQPSILDV